MSKKQGKRKNNRKLRILWSSNGHWTNSGYGVFTRDFLFRLRDNGWPIAEIAFFGLEGYKAIIDDILVYPKINDVYGSDALVNHGVDFKANVIMTMQDIWTLNPAFLQKIKHWIPYMPVDQSPASPMILDRIKYAYKIVTFSNYGQKVLEDHGYASTMIHEGTDTNTFKPMDKMKMRKGLGLPMDAFLFGMISANKENPPRKGYQEILEALKLFIDNHPEGAIFFHTQQITEKGFPLKAYAKHLGIEKRIFFIDQYSASFRSASPEIAKELNAFDVTMHASQTEGFGLVIVESQACGTPVIVNNCMSMPELVIPGKTGEICDTNYAWWRSQGGYVYTSNVKSLHEKMEILYKKVKENEKKISKDCRNHILTNFNIDSIFKEKWIPFLEELQEELLGSPQSERTTGPPNVQNRRP